ncbi:ligand-binding SRPBCC domain-containing protein [Chitinophaga skermanii]|uniref:Ligand-binding SRPBCC domain-containing protein n=1 Tax=Chitinophaga skermanii TaxID=331697 RepID=A0A327Q0Q4_9BACT|nr:SRPBCC family protein [Chitinophaga skermanii]RAI97474.1 ligand-binding SRPBCC domain-containing protein [Chitinophaga skermanii]
MMSKMYSLQKVQVLPVDMKTAWNFFSSPGNLQTITPAYMRFKIISEQHACGIYAGQLISYIVRPVLGIPLRWVTIITQVKEHEYFIDEQQYGPYAFWHHEHRFREVEGGIEMTDIVHYRMKLGVLGRFANSLFVGNQLKDLFSYREKKIREIFNKTK